MYQERMLGYYPQVVQCILEFRSIIDSEYPEFEDLQGSAERVINDAYLLTMTEDRVVQWENILGIRPLENSTIQDRRETIIARIRGQGKLNTALINAIVNAFTGGYANSWVEDSVLYVEVTPPPTNKSFKFENVEQELSLKVPAHLGFKVSRNYYGWAEVKQDNLTWGHVKDRFETWNEVYIFTPFKKEVVR
jgi:hypothetical protein